MGGGIMPYDGVFIHYLVAELQEKLVGCKINKIIEPNVLDIVLQIRSKDTTKKLEQLFISASLDMPRIYLTDEKIVSLDVPKNFCVVLRKYIERGIIQDIRQIRNDRIICFDIQSYSELGDLATYTLVFELMGRNSNLILIDNEHTIIDAIRKLPPTEEATRLILPKSKYVPLLREQAINPFLFLKEASLDQLEGCSKILIGEYPHIDTLYLALQNQPHPYIYQCQEKYDFYLIPLPSKKKVVDQFDSISHLLSTYYQSYREVYTDKAKTLKKVVKAKIVKLTTKLDHLHQDLDQAQQNIIFNHLGLLLQSNLYAVKKGDTSITVADFTNQNLLVKIELDPMLDPSKNLKRIFTKGKKAKNALTQIAYQIEKTEQELAYLDAIFVQIEFASPSDLTEITDELVQNKYIKAKKRNAPKKKGITLTKYDVDGIEVLVGKNNIQNDTITHQMAKPFDWWFHAKDVPGSHVLFRCPSSDYVLSEKEIRFCAELAGRFSKAGRSSSVPIDYTLAKYVKKITGLHGSQVTYTHQKTIYIDPKS